MKSFRMPDPTLRRLCHMYDVLTAALESGSERLSSAQIGRRLGVSAHGVRKDISLLPGSDTGNRERAGGGYDIRRLRDRIAAVLGFSKPVKVCVVGLGRLGTAIMEHERLRPSGFEVTAGFDSNINKLEILKSSVELHPSHEIEQVVRANGIEYGVIAVNEASAAEVADQLVRGGVRGILNFSPAVLPESRDGVLILNMDVVKELRFLVSHITQSKGETQ